MSGEITMPFGLKYFELVIEFLIDMRWLISAVVVILIIKRIIKMQEELVVILNSRNQPFLINGFIYARLTDSALKESIAKLMDDPSPIYKDIVPIKLDSDLISPVSYCLAYDLIKRFETFEEFRKQEVQNIIDTKEKDKEEKIKELRKKQEGSTLNWIERRITSSLIGINKSLQLRIIFAFTRHKPGCYIRN